MANGSPDRPRSSGLFSGLLLISLGVLMLFWTYAHLNLGQFFIRFWPLILIVWGLVKFYERTVAVRQGRTSGWITAGEIFLVVGVFCLVGIVVIVDLVTERVRGGKMPVEFGDFYSFDLDMQPQPVPANAHIQINVPRGDINVHTSDDAQINVGGKRKIRSWNEDAAAKLEDSAKLEIAKDGDTYVVRPAESADNDQRFGFDLDLTIPTKAQLDIKSDRGDITVADVANTVGIASRKGDIEVSDIGGGVTIDTQGGDTKVSDIKGDVKISGKGGEVNVTNATGGLTLNGEFYGPIRAEKLLKGVRFISHRSDFTVSQLTGHMTVESGNFEIVDAPGNLALRTSSADVSIENPGGKVNVDNRNGKIDVRYSSAPKDDIQITNSSSEITLSLPSNTSFDIVGDCHSCDINNEFSSPSLSKTTSRNGDTHLEGKYGSGRSVKIVLRTSYGSITIRKTS
ncbi:MAG: hypothetical protein JSS69_04990 [Acidobacteria bacterium]|nr:hypothetical protein [Acidobacteriota bacterium]MBS1865255.1 hypothetical protein [Acidobacteriota bacterium]